MAFVFKHKIKNTKWYPYCAQKYIKPHSWLLFFRFGMTDRTDTRLECRNVCVCPHHTLSDVLPKITSSWTLLSRPRRMDEICGHNHLKRFVHTHVQNNMPTPCMLLYGPPGTGKTSMARSIVRQYEIKDYLTTDSHIERMLPIHTLELNASERRNHNDIVSAIIERIEYLKHIKEPTLQFFIIDECDAMTTHAQMALCSAIDMIVRINEDPHSMSKIGIIAVCNNISLIDWHLQSSLLSINFEIPNIKTCHEWLLRTMIRIMCDECSADISNAEGVSKWQLYKWARIGIETVSSWIEGRHYSNEMNSCKNKDDKPIDMRQIITRAQAHVQSIVVRLIESNHIGPTQETDVISRLFVKLTNMIHSDASLESIRSIVQDIHRIGIDNIQLSQRLLQYENNLGSQYEQTSSQAVIKFITRTQSLAVIPDIYIYSLIYTMRKLGKTSA